MPQCYQSIVIAAPIDQVWDTVKNFHDFSWAAGVIDSCEAVGSIGGSEIGAQRILNGLFHETLLECNAAGRDRNVARACFRPIASLVSVVSDFVANGYQTMQHVSTSPPAIPDSQISRVRF